MRTRGGACSAPRRSLLARRSLTRDSGARSSRPAGRPAVGQIRARPRCAAARRAAINFVAIVSTYRLNWY
eukprot:684060-Prymnesium_polylepis.2